jgi:hypothetical protein
MKKQLLIAAVAATMTSAAMADISISGSAKTNYINTDSATETSDTNAFSTEIDLGIAGSTGGSGVVVNLQSKNSGDNDDFDVQDSYVTSSVGDINIKAGSWRGLHNLLEDGDATSANRFKAWTTVGGVTITFEDASSTAAKGESIKLEGSVAGAALSHKMSNDGAGVDTTDSSISGSIAGVSIAYRSIDSDTANTDTESLQVSTEMNGITATYAMVDSEGTGNSITMDGFLGDISGVSEAEGFGIKTSMAGNTIQIKSIDVSTAASGAGADDSYTKFYVTRPLASGATFEAIYSDKDAASGSTADSKTLDLELAVKF